MRVKIGDQWFQAEPGQPVMIELEPKDRTNILNMTEGATRYAIFDHFDDMTEDERQLWMDDGAARQ
jgi:hypothetical protein